MRVTEHRNRSSAKCNPHLHAQNPNPEQPDMTWKLAFLWASLGLETSEVPSSLSYLMVLCNEVKPLLSGFKAGAPKA